MSGNAFGKLYEQTFTGSMFGAGPVVFSVWAYVVAHLRPPGVVELNPKHIAAAIGASVEDIRKAIEVLTSPDPESRTKDHEGRRLLKENGFFYRAPNFARYRNGTDEERRAANAARQKRYRARKKYPLNVKELGPVRSHDTQKPSRNGDHE